VFERSKDFQEELEFARAIQKNVDPEANFTIPVLASCSVQYFRKSDQVQKCDLIKPHHTPSSYKQIIYPNAGKDLDYVLDDNTPLRGSPKTFLKLLKAFRPIIEGLGKFTQQKLIHTDIKGNNIMYKKGQLYLIDFGRVVHHDEMFTRSIVPILLDDLFWNPPEYKAFIHPRSDGAVALYKNIAKNFGGSSRHLLRALTTHLRMNPIKDLEAFFNANVLQKQYQKLFVDKIDIYSLGLVILDLYIWSEYHEQVYKTNSPKAVIREMVVNLLRGMVQFDPRRRSSSAEAVAQLDDIIKLMECLKRPTRDLKRSPSATGQRPTTRLNICVGKLVS
jgi:serine/threonine protein kinase